MKPIIFALFILLAGCKQAPVEVTVESQTQEVTVNYVSPTTGGQLWQLKNSRTSRIDSCGILWQIIGSQVKGSVHVGSLEAGGASTVQIGAVQPVKVEPYFKR